MTSLRQRLRNPKRSDVSSFNVIKDKQTRDIKNKSGEVFVKRINNNTAPRNRKGRKLI